MEPSTRRRQPAETTQEPDDDRFDTLSVRILVLCPVVLAPLSWCSNVRGSEPAEPDWVKATDKIAFQARDSSGEVVFHDRMWILGGWFSSYAEPPRDVWSSADGVQWERATENASWKHADLPTSLVFDDRMWMMGGWHLGRLPGASGSNEVWFSRDGGTGSRRRATPGGRRAWERPAWSSTARCGSWAVPSSTSLERKRASATMSGAPATARSGNR